MPQQTLGLKRPLQSRPHYCPPALLFLFYCVPLLNPHFYYVQIHVKTLKIDHQSVVNDRGSIKACIQPYLGSECNPGTLELQASLVILPASLSEALVKIVAAHIRLSHLCVRQR
jgi:hypothetical protein